jgi:hypothetical protein
VTTSRCTWSQSQFYPFGDNVDISGQDGGGQRQTRETSASLTIRSTETNSLKSSTVMIEDELHRKSRCPHSGTKITENFRDVISSYLARC